MSVWRSRVTQGERLRGEKGLEMLNTKEQAKGFALCVGAWRSLPAHQPLAWTCSLSQSLCWVLLPLQLWCGDEAPVIHSLDRQLAPLGPLPLSQGAAWPASSPPYGAGLRPRQPRWCQGRQELRASVGRGLSLLPSPQPRTGQLCQRTGWSQKAEGQPSYFQGLTPAEGTPVVLGVGIWGPPSHSELLL